MVEPLTPRALALASDTGTAPEAAPAPVRGSANAIVANAVARRAHRRRDTVPALNLENVMTTSTVVPRPPSNS
jgi:hypothetical protein